MFLPSILTLVACWNWHVYPWHEIPSPDGSRVAVINSDSGGGIGGDTTRVRVRSRGDRATTLVFEIHACPILYVFWLDDDHLEIQLTPRIHPCTYREGTSYPVEGVKVSVTTPASTLKADVRASSIEP
jgi:hypothetical protein